MPFPATRYSLSHVDPARGQGSSSDPCVHPQIHCLLWRCQPTEREVHLCTLTHIQCGHVRNVLEKTASPPVPGEKDGRHFGQRPLPPRQAAKAAAEETSETPRASVPAAIQPSTGSDRASVEVGSSIGHTQSVLCQSERGTNCHRILFRSVAKTQLSAAQTMRHYLRRYV